MIAKGTTKYNVIYHGQNKVQRIYKGNNKIYEYLPINYTECKYISSNADAHIVTDFIPNNFNNNYTVILDIQITDLTSSNSNFYICGTGTTGGRSCNIRISSSGAMAGYNHTGSSATLFASVTASQADVLNRNIFKMVLIDGGISKIIKDNVEYTENVTTNSNSTNTFKIFYATGNKAKMKLFNCKIYDENNKLIRYYIPCLDDSNVPCLYEQKTKTTLYNAGSGTFGYEIV